ncbi:hypothetical protein QOZ80_1BG0053480 [Eleusine coracana subsp. coracana]|nr:hypothetical protein QOZ80_1BG0053450 [Eleusine coracana subsp. coracana]KAK3159966.1 hypothetical protein QOZ80_1BG0053480 [Eleusine coracana subsp. coracana]
MESQLRKRAAMDRLSSLPDDLLHSILLELPLKHAARTTAISRRWAPLWLRALASSPVLDFTDRDFVNGQTPARAAATVQRCLEIHAEHGPPLHAFHVALDGTPGGEVERDVIVGWVASAVARGAMEVEVDLIRTRRKGAHHLQDDDPVFLELPGDVFLTETSLAWLSLDRYSLRAVPRGAPGLAGLRSLSLSRADVTDDAVNAVVSNCRLLESLSLRSCHLLTSVRIAAGENLRRLEIVRCSAVRELRVAAPGLESFAFHGDIVYLGDSEDDDEGVAAVDLGATPALRDAYLSHIGFGHVNDTNDKEYAYSDFLSCIAHARTLTLCSVGLLHMWDQLSYDEGVEIDMTNVQELQLLMASLGNNDYYGLEAVSSFFQIMELPLLDRLFVRLPCELPPAAVESDAAVAPTGEVDDRDVHIYGNDFVFDQLRLIKVVNFRGTKCELVMLAFLVKRAPILEQLVVVTVDEDEVTEEQVKIIQGQVSMMRKASQEARITVCRPSEDRSSQNPAHTRFYHEE